MDYYYLVMDLVRKNNIKINPFINTLRGWAILKDRTIEIPRPTTKLRLSIALHEVGHIVLKHHKAKKRYIEETEAWNYAFKIMKLNKISIPNKVKARRKRSITYAINKAKRRGLQDKIHKNIFNVV